MSKLGLIIFSRMGSSRLPGKALIDIEGRCLLGRVIDRAKKVRNIDQIVVATSTKSEDDSIEKFALKENLSCYRGSENDVAMRAFETSKLHNFSSFVRLCGDRPFFDYELVSELSEFKINNNFDIVTTMFPRTYPPGLTTEIISTHSLELALSHKLNSYDREHLTSFFYRRSDLFTIKNFDIPIDLDLSNVHLVVDTEKDLRRSRWIAKHITDNSNMHKIIELAKEWETNNKEKK